MTFNHKFKSSLLLFDPIRNEEHFNEFCDNYKDCEVAVLKSWLRDFSNWSTGIEGTPQSERRNKLIAILNAEAL